MKTLLLATVAALAIRAHMSDTCDVVTVKGKGGDPVRMNKSDFDADQASDKPQFSLHTDEGKGNTEQSSGAGVILGLPDDVIVPPAPSAPQFDKADTAVVPPEAGAPVVPTIPAPNALLIKKGGTEKKPKFFVTDNAGVEITDREGIDKAGYDSEKEAWDAILAQPH